MRNFQLGKKLGHSDNKIRVQNKLHQNSTPENSTSVSKTSYFYPSKTDGIISLQPMDYKSK